MREIISPLSGIRSPFGLRDGRFSPAVLFANNEPGVWYDPSDLSTLFQDTAGTTPVTTPGQTVALMLDKSGNDLHATQPTAAARPTYGIVPAGGRRNLLTFSEQFDNAAWIKSQLTHSSNVLTAGAVTGDPYLYAPITSVGGVATASVRMSAGNHNLVCVTCFRSSNSYGAQVFDLSDGSTGQSGGTLFLSSEITPLGGGEYVLTVSASDLTAANNGVIISFAPAKTGNTFTSIGTIDATWSGSETLNISTAQLEEGSTATAYQKVTTQFDVTEAGVESLGYLSFDGVDDWMVTPTITPGIDKVFVGAGVRKLSVANTMAIAETSANPDTNAGVFSLASVATSGNSFFRSKGTTQGDTNAVSSVAPITRIVSGLGDISGDRTTLRVDGAQAAQSVADQGTGNYLAYPMYIGSRGGTTLRFNGHLYSLITRFGDNLPVETISQVEGYIASKSGVSI